MTVGVTVGVVAMVMDTVTLSYSELARRLGIEVASAKRRAMRAKWGRVKGNDGRTLVRVPLDVLPPVSPETVGAVSGVSVGVVSPVTVPTVDVAALQADLAARTAEVEALKVRVAVSEALAMERWETILELGRRLDAASTSHIEERQRLLDVIGQLSSRPWWRRLFG